MPTLSPSTNVVRIHAGGTINISDGTDDFDIVLYEAGSLSETVGEKEKHEFTDRGVAQQPVEGDDQMSEFEVAFKHASDAVADEVINAKLLQASTDGKAVEFTVIINRPDYRGATTGLRHTYTQAHIPSGGVQMGGSPFEMVRVRFRSRNNKPTIARYS